MATNVKEKAMNAAKNIPTLVAAATAALAAVTVGLTAGLAPASAAPAQTPGASLVVTSDPANSANYRVVVKGVYPMNEYDAHGFINNIGTGERVGGMDYAIKGDDPDSNDLILGDRHFNPGAGHGQSGYLVAESDGIHYFEIISVPKGLLNEDFKFDGTDATDEVYVQADFIDGDGGVRTQYTNPVSGSF
jgi:hypothetical protein